MSKRTAKIGRPPAGEIEERKRTILEMATKLFIAQGFEMTTVADIAAAAGVTKRTIYDHIGDKKTLFHAVCMECIPRMFELRFDHWRSGRTTREALKELGQLLWDYTLAPETVALTRMLMVERLRFPELVQESTTAMSVLCRKLIQEALNEMIELDLLPPLDTYSTVDRFYDLVVGSIQLQMAFDVIAEMPPETELDDRIDVFLHGVLGRQRDVKSA